MKIKQIPKFIIKEIKGFIKWFFSPQYVYKVRGIDLDSIELTLKEKHLGMLLPTDTIKSYEQLDITSLQDLYKERENKKNIFIINKECVYYSSFFIKLCNISMVWGLLETLILGDKPSLIIVGVILIVQKLTIIENKR